MKLSDHDLRQLDESYIGSLAHDQLMTSSLKLLTDLKVAATGSTAPHRTVLFPLAVNHPG